MSADTEADNSNELESTEGGLQFEKSLTDWKNEPGVRELKQDLTDATPDHHFYTGKIDQWLENLNVTGNAKPNTPKGQSSVVPQLIRKQAEWRYAALTEPFLSTEEMYDIAPATHADKDAAKQNQLVLNNQFSTQVNKTQFIDEYVRTAVDEGTVIVRIGWEFEEEQVSVKVPEVEFRVNPEMAELHEELHQMMESDPAQFEQEVPEELKEAHQMTMERGEPIEAEVVGMKEEQQTRIVKNRPTLQVCNYRNVILDPTAQGDPDKATFAIYSFETSMAELKKDDKYQNLDHINVANSDILAQPDHTTENTSNFNFADKSRKKFVAYEYWGYWDIEDNGTLEPIVATWVGDTLIRMEKNPFPDKKIPFVVVQYLPVRRSLYGEPDGALLEDNQKILGAVTRGMIDVMGRAANGQTGVRKDALDVTNQRKFERGEDYEFNANVHPDNAFYMHTWPEIPTSAQFMLELQNRDAESLTGVQAFSGNGVSGESLGNTATGVRGALDAASKREMGILRRLSDGMVKIGRKIIAMNAEFLSEEEVVRRTEEEFVPIRRDDLAGKFDLKLSISTPESDEQKAEDLAFMLQTMGNNMDPKLSSIILADIANLRKMPELAKRIENHEPEPDPMQVEKAQLEIELLRAQIENERSDTRKTLTDASYNMARAESEGAKAENTQSLTDKQNLDYVEQESGVKQERELEKQGEQARSQAELKAVDHALGAERDEMKEDREDQRQYNQGAASNAQNDSNVRSKLDRALQ